MRVAGKGGVAVDYTENNTMTYVRVAGKGGVAVDYTKNDTITSCRLTGTQPTVDL